MFSIFRIMAEFLSYLLAIKVLTAKKNESLDYLDKNLIYNLGRIKVGFKFDLVKFMQDELFDEVSSF